MTQKVKSLSVNLWRYFVVALWGFAVFALPTAAVANAIEGATEWFSEDVDTFEANASGCWSFSPNSAFRDDGRIRIYADDDEAESVYYHPANAATGTCVIVEQVMRFYGGCDEDSASGGAYAGVMLMETSEESGEFVFAVLNPTAGNNEWFKTEVSAKTNVDYVIRATIDYTDGSQSATYVYKLPGGEAFLPLATMALPTSIAKPTEMEYSGNGAITTIDAATKSSGGASGYDRWSYANGIVTWAAEGSSYMSITDASKAWFMNFKKTGEVWADDPSLVWTGGVKYAEFPGYKGEATEFWHSLVKGNTGYVAPGMVLRFVANSKAAPQVRAAQASPSEVAIGGLIVEPGAKGYGGSEYSIYRSLTSLIAKTAIGDTSGNAVTRYYIGEDFGIMRGYKAGSEVRFYGTIDLEVAEGKQFSINVASANLQKITNRLDEATAANLRFHGDGQLEVANLFATGAVTLDFSDLSATRAIPFINGPLTIDGDTEIVLPAELAENTPMVIASQAFTSPVTAVMRPRKIDGEKMLVTIVYDTTAKTASWTKELIPTADVTIPEGYKLTINGAADPATPYEWSGKMTVDGSLVVNGCAKFTNAFVLNGTLYFDGSKLTPITSGRIAVVTLADGYKIDISKVVNLSEGTWNLVAVDNVLYAYMGTSDYKNWSYAKGRVVTWVSPGTAGDSISFDSSSAKFKEFDIDTTGDGETTYTGNSSYKAMPGYSGTTAYPFWNLFSSSKGCYLTPGDTLRLRAYVEGDMVGKMTFDASPFSLGGLIVEEGAATGSNRYSIETTSNYETQLGDKTGLIETWFSAKEDFKFARNGNMTLYGPININVAAGKVLNLNASYGNRTLTLDATTKTKLRMHGEGAITNATMTATGAVTLDFTDLKKDRGPFILGSLAVDTNTVFAFPAELAENEKFKLCQGSLTIPTENPARYIMVGEDAFYATLTFDTATKPTTVSYVRGGDAVNKATLSANVAWANISWNDGKGWVDGLPAQITLTQDVRIEFTAAATVDRLCFLGGYKASLVFVKTPTLSNVTASMGAEYEYVIPQSSEMTTSTALAIPAGEVWVIEGGSDAANPRNWSGKIAVTGTLKTRGQVKLSNGSNTVQSEGTLEVDNGTCYAIGSSQGFKGQLNIPLGSKFECQMATDYLSYANDEVTVNVWGELSLPGARWTLGKNTTLNLYAGGEISGDGQLGQGALDFYLMKQLNVLAADGEDTAKLSATIRYRNNPAFNIATGVTLKLTGEPIQYGGDRSVSLQGGGSMEICEGAEIVLAGNSCCDGGVFGKGEVAFLTIPESERLVESFSDNQKWFGQVWFKGVTFGAFNPDAYGNSASTVRVSGCRGYFPSGTHTIATTLELGEATSAHPTAFMVESGYAKSTITIPTLIGSGRLLMSKGNASGNSAVFLPNASQLACSIIINQEAEHIATIAGQSAGAFSGDYGEHAGEIYVVGGHSARIGTNSTFTAVNGIVLPNEATLVNDGGTIGSQVKGSGTVKYVGIVGEEGIEEAAGFENEEEWKGTVTFQGARFEGATYGRFRNDNSKVTISQNEICTASSVKWVDGITLNAEEGDTVMRFDEEPSEGFDQLTIHLVGEPTKTFGLEYDADTGGVVLTTKASAPTMDIVDLRVVYGTDLEDARVAFTVENFNEGYLYSGGTAAILTVRDSEGYAYVSKGVWIDGDGDYYFDPVELRDGRGAGYTYEITVSTMREAGSDEEFVANGGVAEFVTRREGGWIHETAATFPPEAAGKTGEWTMDPQGVAVVTNGVIRLGDDDGNPGDLNFRAYVASKESVVSVEVTLEATAGAPEDPQTMPDDMQSAITIGEDAEADNALVFYAWSPTDSEYVKLYIAAVQDRPTSGSNYTVRAVFDYDSGFVTYSVDGFALTNSAGAAFVPMTTAGSEAGKLNGVLFSGNGSIAEVYGEQRNGNLAKVDGVEYRTLDEALEHAADGAKVELLWDATWHPVGENVGRKFDFVGDFDVVIDEDSVTTLERSGYQLVHNPDGTYLVDVTTYYLSYSGNGALGEMESVAFSATNLVLQLAANAFEYTGKDFQYWNSQPDGSGPSNYVDKAEIDLTPYGFTNVTLYAQWRVARRLVTVASADAGVYLESVKTNYVNHGGVSFYQFSGSGESVSASFEVDHGSQVELYFSTDIEKSLTPYNYLNLGQITEATTAVPYADLPKIFGLSMQKGLSILEQWAYSKGISTTSLASSDYKAASYGLNVSPLINEKTEVRLVDFAATETGCSFKVLVDGQPIVDRAAIVDMIWVSNDLKNWVQAPTESVTIDGETISIATTESGKFVKIVVPKD